MAKAKTTEEIAPIAPTPTDNPLALLDKMIERGAGAAELERMSALVERWLDRQAKERYGQAMAEFHRRCPPIVQQRIADVGTFRYNFAAYEDIKKVTNPIDAELGISTSFSLPSYDPAAGTVSGFMTVRVGSYSEEKHFTVRIPKAITNASGKSVINDTQMDGQAISYFKRYAFINGRDIVVTNEDNDANFQTTITTEMRMALEQAIIECSADITRFLKHFGVEHLADLPHKCYGEAVAMLRQKGAKIKL